MLSLSKDPLTVVAANLSSRNIGNLRSASQQIYSDLEHTAQFVAISTYNPCYSDEVCHQAVNELSQFASDLTEGLQGKNKEQVQAYVDTKRNALSEDFTKNSLSNDNAQTHFVQMKEALKKVLIEDEKCDSQSKKLLCRRNCAAKLKIITEEAQKINTCSRFVGDMIRQKLDLLAIEYVVLLSKAGRDDEFVDIPHEMKLAGNFQTRVDNEVLECGVENLDRTIQSALLELNRRSYLSPFASSPDTISLYLKKLEDNLASASKEAHAPRSTYFDCIIS